MGEVFLAHDLTLDRPVALKILPEAFAAELVNLMPAEDGKRVMQQAEITVRVASPTWSSGYTRDRVGVSRPRRSSRLTSHAS